MTGAVIIAAEVAAGHDGAAELLLTLRHENGIVGSVALDAEVGFGLMTACGADSLMALVGRAWRDVLKGI